MNKKQLLDYESPTTQLINLRIESGILTVSGDGDPNPWTPGNSNWFDDED